MARIISITLLNVFIALWVIPIAVCAQSSKTDPCTVWQAKIDKSLGNSPLVADFDKLSEKQILTAIECLLALEGNQNEARFSGAVKDHVSSVPQSTPVEVSALYYISYLYYQKFDHADIVALYDASGEFSTPFAIKKAYKSYRKWFEEVKKIGVAKARETKLDPLGYTEVKWY